MQSKSTRGVQQVDVDFAADALVAERLRPTVERVRMKLGRGSPNTVGPMLEAWFGTLGPRLGVVAAGDEGQALPPAVRDAMDKVWMSAMSMASDQAAQAIAREREVLAADRLELSRAREAVSAQQAAHADREAVLQESLSLARSQLMEASQRASQLDTKLESVERELGAARQTLADMVQEHAGERRANAEQLRTQAADLRQAQERAVSAERRLLEDVDRARQEAKQVRRELADAQRAHDKDFKALEQSNLALGRRHQDSQIEIASLRERLAGAEARTADLQGMLKTRAAAGGSRLPKGKANAKAISASQPGPKRAAASSGGRSPHRA